MVLYEPYIVILYENRLHEKENSAQYKSEFNKIHKSSNRLVKESNSMSEIDFQ